jgi:putative tricarboxylic transport membrane protein
MSQPVRPEKNMPLSPQTPVAEVRPTIRAHARLTTSLAALVFLLLGVWICLQAGQLPFGSFRMPGAGFFPLLLGVILSLLSLILLATSLLGHPETVPMSSVRREVFYLMGAILTVPWLFERLGFLCTMVLFLGVLLKALGKFNWTATIVVAVVGSVAAYVLFSRVLLIGLPAGILPW